MQWSRRCHFFGRERELEDLRGRVRRPAALPRDSLRSTAHRQVDALARGGEGRVCFGRFPGDDRRTSGRARSFKGRSRQKAWRRRHYWRSVQLDKCPQLVGESRTNRKGLIVILDEFLTSPTDKTPFLESSKSSGTSTPPETGIWTRPVRPLVSYMEDLLTEQHPLFGRRTMSLELGPMPLREAAQFLPSYAPSEMISAYTVFGGVPKYLELCARGPLFARISSDSSCRSPV